MDKTRSHKYTHMYTCTAREYAMLCETIYDGRMFPYICTGIMCPTYYDRTPHMYNRNGGGASFKVGVACYIHVTYINTTMTANKHGGGGGGGGGT